MTVGPPGYRPEGQAVSSRVPPAGAESPPFLLRSTFWAGVLSTIFMGSLSRGDRLEEDQLPSRENAFLHMLSPPHKAVLALQRLCASREKMPLL